MSTASEGNIAVETNESKSHVADSQFVIFQQLTNHAIFIKCDEIVEHFDVVGTDVWVGCDAVVSKE